MRSRKSFVAIGNFDSNTGYAWKLMESLWIEANDAFSPLGMKPLVAFPSVSEQPKDLVQSGFSVDCINFKASSARDIFKQCAYIRRNRVKILYFTDYPTASFRYFIFRIMGVRCIVVHDHMPGARTKPDGFKRLLKSMYNRLPFFAADRCFAVSPYIAERLKDVNCYPERRIVCITNGIALPESFKKEYANGDAISIVTVGRATYYKGVDFALRVVAQLVNSGYSNIRYTLYGDGPDLDDFKQLAEDLGIAEHVSFPGATSNINQKLIDHDIAFHPSKGEAMSLAMLEYMGAGLPLLTSNNPSVSSFLKDDVSASIYKAENIDNCADQLKRLIEKPDVRERLGRRGRADVEENFSREKMFSHFRAALVEVAEKKDLF